VALPQKLTGSAQTKSKQFSEQQSLEAVQALPFAVQGPGLPTPPFPPLSRSRRLRFLRRRRCVCLC
jgi:hypothetical protein